MPWHRLDTLRLDYLIIDKANDSNKTGDLHLLINISGAAFTKHNHLAKDFLNYCIKNYMFDDSWIDTTYGIASQIQFLQAKFDLAETHARKLRKALYENCHATDKFTRTTMKALLKECEAEVNIFEHETTFGRNKEELQKWQNYIAGKLKELAEYESSERNTPKTISK